MYPLNDGFDISFSDSFEIFETRNRFCVLDSFEVTTVYRCCYICLFFLSLLLYYLSLLLSFFTTEYALNSVALLMQNNTIHPAVLRIFCFTSCVGLPATDEFDKCTDLADAAAIYLHCLSFTTLLSFYTTDNPLKSVALLMQNNTILLPPPQR
jgi:hypothetical protein